MVDSEYNPYNYKSLKISIGAVIKNEEIFLKYCPDRYMTQKMCDKAFDACLLALKFVPD